MKRASINPSGLVLVASSEPVMQAIDESRGNRIRHAHENVRNSLANTASCLSGIRRDGDENVNLKPDKFGCKLWKAVKVAVLMAILDENVLPLYITELT
jgi:hypothetical protein